MAKVTASVAAGSSGVTRREFLYYIWGASIALFTAQSAGFLVWFLIPRFREGEFGGKFVLPISDLPEPNGEPRDNPAGRFWLVNLDTDQPNARMFKAQDETTPIKGVAAIYKVCTHLGCIYSWTPANNRFECPCHGSKYRLDGRRIEEPAPRALDRFKVEALDANRNVLAVSEEDSRTGVFLPLTLPPNTALLSIDTGDRNLGSDEDLLCSFTGTCP